MDGVVLGRPTAESLGDKFVTAGCLWKVCQGLVEILAGGGRLDETSTLASSFQLLVMNYASNLASSEADWIDFVRKTRSKVFKESEEKDNAQQDAHEFLSGHRDIGLLACLAERSDQFRQAVSHSCKYRFIFDDENETMETRQTPENMISLVLDKTPGLQPPGDKTPALKLQDLWNNYWADEYFPDYEVKLPDGRGEGVPEHFFGLCF